MPNKYIREGAAFNGDGTSPDLATADGGVGAWNTITYFENIAPAYGSIADGDVIYIRSKNETGADILTASSGSKILGVAGLTVDSLGVTWVIDGGSVWPGVLGTVTYTSSAAAAVIVFSQYNTFIADPSRNLVAKTTYSSLSDGIGANFNNCKVDNLYIDTSSITHASYYDNISAAFVNSNLITNLYIKTRKGTTYIAGYKYITTPGTSTILINPIIELTGSANSDLFIFGANSYSTGGSITVFGGKLINPFTAQRTIIFATVCDINLIGFEYPATDKLSNKRGESFSMDGSIGTQYSSESAIYTSRYDAFYPTLNAQIDTDPPKSYSIAIYPLSTSSANPAVVTMSKLYTLADAVKTVTVEFLWPTNFPAPTSRTAILSISYKDSSGLEHGQSTLGGASVLDSSAVWSPDPPTYGVTHFLKKKLSITTDYAVKKNTAINVCLQLAGTAVTSNDIFVVDPDPILT